MWNGKRKAITFSFDDGVAQDERMIAILNKYGLKATFNLNSGLLGKEGSIVVEGNRVGRVKFSPEEVKRVYQGHEMAVHTIDHVRLPEQTDEENSPS